MVPVASAALGFPLLPGMDDQRLLEELLAGIDPDWEKKLRSTTRAMG